MSWGQWGYLSSTPNKLEWLWIAAPGLVDSLRFPPTTLKRMRVRRHQGLQGGMGHLEGRTHTIFHKRAAPCLWLHGVGCLLCQGLLALYGSSPHPLTGRAK